MWSKKAKPNTANIRRRIEAAEAAVDAAMDLVKLSRHFGKGGPLVPLDNAHGWLVEANRRLK